MRANAQPLWLREYLEEAQESSSQEQEALKVAQPRAAPNNIQIPEQSITHEFRCQVNTFLDQ